MILHIKQNEHALKNQKEVDQEKIIFTKVSDGMILQLHTAHILIANW